MSAVVADTHTILWYLAGDPQLSSRAREAMEQATADGEPIWVPTICIVEVTYLAEKNRIEARALPRLEQALREPGSAFEAIPLTTEIAYRLKEVPRSSVPDLPDRVIAATALALGLPLITRDGQIQTSGIATIW